MPTAEDRLARTAEELNRAVDGRPVPAWSPSSTRPVTDISSSRRRRGGPSYVWLAAMVVLIAGLVVLALTVAGGDDEDSPAVDPPSPGSGGAETRTVPMLDGSRLEIDLPDELAGLQPTSWNVTLLTGGARTQLTVLPMTFEAWRTTLAPPGTWDSDPPLVAGERLNATTRLYQGHGSDGVGGTFLVFDGGGAVGYVIVERAGAVNLPRSEIEALASSVAVVGDVQAPWVQVHPPTELQRPSVTLRSETGQELALTRTECDAAQADRPGLVLRCVPEAEVVATLGGARGSLLDELRLSAAFPSGGDPPTLQLPSGLTWQRSRSGELAGDLVERVMAEVLGDPVTATIDLRSYPPNRPVISVETRSGAVVAAEFANLGGVFHLLRLSSPGLRRIADSTFVADVAGTLTVAGAPNHDDPEVGQEVFVEGVPVTPGERIGPFSFPESSWIEATLTMADGRILHLFEAR